MTTDEVVITNGGPDWLTVETDLPGVEPAEALRWFVEAPLLNRWWGEEAMIEPRRGGIYHVHWPALNWTMRGTIVSIGSTHLVYSWAWDHERDAPPRAVVVTVEATGSGSKVVVGQGPYRPASAAGDPDAVERAMHAEGWLTVLPVLRAKICAPDLASRRT